MAYNWNEDNGYLDDSKNEAFIEENSLYMHGYKYGNAGKFPRPAGMGDEWDTGYADGRGDWLASIQFVEKEK